MLRRCASSRTVAVGCSAHQFIPEAPAADVNRPQCGVERRENRDCAIVRRGESAQLDLRTVARDMRLASGRALEIRRGQIGSVAGKLNALSPLATLSRGYAIARDNTGKTLGSVADFAPERDFELLLQDGKILARPVRNGGSPDLDTDLTD